MSPESTRANAIWVVLASLLAAAILSLLPVPVWLEIWRPEWVAIVLVYWVMALPHRIGLVTAWVTGFFIDILEGSLLGLNALALALITYLALNLYQRLRMFTALQQSTTILMLIGIYQLLVFWILTVSNQNTPDNLMFMMSAVSSAIVWPFMFLFLRYVRRSFRVN